MGVFRTSIGVIITILAVVWLNRPPKYDWKPHEGPIKFSNCPKNTKEIHFLFGGTSMLGRYIVETWKNEFEDVCLINYNRNECQGCDISYIGDIRDTKYIETLLKHHQASRLRISTVIYSIKPALEFTDYKTFIEVNLNSLVEITKIVKGIGIPNLVYTSSIACSNHYEECHYCTEKSRQPLLTEYEAPYDLSKRLAENYILGEADETFKTVALRVSGILGGVGDPFFHHRAFPFILTYNNPVIVDYNYAANIADALAEVTRVLKGPKGGEVSGKFFYYTGEDIKERVVADKLVQVTGKPLLQLPAWTLAPMIDFWQWFRWTHAYYTVFDLMRMSNVEQTFDQSLFHNTFPGFSPKYSVLEAIEQMYGSAGKGRDEL